MSGFFSGAPDFGMGPLVVGTQRNALVMKLSGDGQVLGAKGFGGDGNEEGLYIAVDSLGYMWATSAMGIQVCEQPGRCTNILNKPEFNAPPIASIAFGGPDRTWLYVTQGGKLFRRQTRRTGVVAWELVKPPQPGL